MACIIEQVLCLICLMPINTKLMTHHVTCFRNGAAHCSAQLLSTGFSCVVSSFADVYWTCPCVTKDDAMVKPCVQVSDTAAGAETQASDIPSATPVVDATLLLNVNSVFACNLADLLDVLGVLHC